MQAINDAPSIQAFDTNLLYKENAAPMLLDSNALVVDVDGLDFDLATMTITLLNGEASDRLNIRQQGTLPGQVGVSGDTVSFGGTTIRIFERRTERLEPTRHHLQCSSSLGGRAGRFAEPDFCQRIEYSFS